MGRQAGGISTAKTLVLLSHGVETALGSVPLFHSGTDHATLAL